MTFVLGLHNHQPVGNFEHIFEEAYSKAYYPFLRVLEGYPDIPFVLHNSGVLWDWLAAEKKEYMQLLESMVSRGQIEIMSGGYYEPILTAIPERDRQGQLAAMSCFVEERFGTVPAGCWLTERIWEPRLPKTLADAGLRYVVVDDAHFKSTGFRSEDMRGYFTTEEDGTYLFVFPIDKKLRYLIPFSDPEETISYLREVAMESGKGPRVAVLADDGEKFGLWTGTHNLCYKKKWLRRFCDLLRRNSDWLKVSTFSKVIDEFKPLGIVYLPTASYSEMMQWALPLRAQESYIEAEQVLRSRGIFEEPVEMIRGGFWRNFLVKYEESNWMHKRMLFVSDLLEKYGAGGGSPEIAEEALGHLYQAQCNCAYWHGLFGGLYLPHLRSAVYSHLIESERLIECTAGGEKPEINHIVTDMDGDGVDEVVLSSPHLKASFKLRGGALRELDLRSPAFNLTDTLTRREEIYHKDLLKLCEKRKAGGKTGKDVVSIHDVSSIKEKGLEKHLVYDFHPRASMLDHFIGNEVDLSSFSSSSYRERGDFIDGLYGFRPHEEEHGKAFVFEREGTIEAPKRPVKLSLVKTIRLAASSPGLEVEYELEPLDGPLECRFAVESVVSLLAGRSPDRFFVFPGRALADSCLASAGEEKGVAGFSLMDEWLKIEITFGLTPEAVVWRFPIDTVSNSESGFERIYQGSGIVTVWKLDLRRGERAEFRIHLGVQPVGA